MCYKDTSFEIDGDGMGMNGTNTKADELDFDVSWLSDEWWNYLEGPDDPAYDMFPQELENQFQDYMVWLNSKRYTNPCDADHVETFNI